ncbi:NAD-dependent epimerase/dehydratase family protein [Streptomyces specialis]|uniref:NAD-dependent epimerase/dehydratase family protein n=1 Tax=Streptomyces specialis TaxID=498367 RepID=UPI002D21BE9C|nr:NAD-dependent epimerase/dehydratase family protein [Streptomyces specialis]
MGATGNIGSRLVRLLAADERVGSVVGVARRPPRWTLPRTTWVRADITKDPGLAALFAGADVVVNLAVLFQPSRHPDITWRTNVIGGERVFRAVAEAGVPALVHASSVVAYGPGPKDRPVDENWPTDGWPTAPYPREKAYLERLLDIFEHRHPGVRVVRLRPGIVIAAESAPQQRRVFVGPYLPGRRPPGALRLVPSVPRMRFQALHRDDAADAFHRAVLRPVHGPFNLAADPVVDAGLVAELTGARTFPLPYRAARAAVDLAWRARLLATSADMFDAVLALPLMDTSRARLELGWTPRHSASDAITEFLAGLRQGGGTDTPPLRRTIPHGGRLREAATGTGERQ